MKTLNIDIFDTKSVNQAIRELEKSQKILEKFDEIVKRIAEVGFEVAKKGFAEPMEDNYQGTDVVMFKKASGGYSIHAFGEQVCYVEFGAGTTYGYVYSYDGDIPLEIDPIGWHNTLSPGNPSKGMNPPWQYTDKNGRLRSTYGIMAHQPMNLALHAMRQEAPKIIAEVLSKDD